MEDEECLSRVETADNGVYYLLIQRLCQEIDDIDLYVTDGDRLWTTKITEEIWKEMAKNVEMNVGEYVQQSLEALTCQNSKNHFIYQVVKDDPVIQFSWKKVLDNEVKYQLGSISLKLKDSNKELMQKILDFSITKIREYKANISSMKSDIERLSKDRGNAILRLEKCVSSKEEMELDLFQKFVTVLNDKKAKIRRLQETITQLQLKTGQNKEIAKNDVIVDEGNKNSIKDSVDHPSRKNLDTSSELKKDQKMCVDDSDLFKTEEDTGPVLKRRVKRTRQATRNEAVQMKAVLPEVKLTPVKRTTSTISTSSSTSSLDRCDSNSDQAKRSSKRKKDISTFPDDVEDLFGDMA